MLSEKSTCIVKNRSSGRVVYQIPDMGITRHFAPGEVQKISYGELIRLTYQPGGKSLIANFLQIQTEEAIQQLEVPVQPEYYMSEIQIQDLIKVGSYEAFLDCLDYAPAGVIDLLKEYAISIPLSDFQKREAMKEKLGFDVDKILANKKAEEEEAKNPGGFVADATPAAKAATSTTARPAARRTSVNYKTENTTK